MREVSEWHGEALRVPSRPSWNSTLFIRSPRRLARDGTRARPLARSEETALGWRTRGREDRDTLCSLHRGLAAAWVINVTIQRSECRAVNGGYV